MSGPPNRTRTAARHVSVVTLTFGATPRVPGGERDSSDWWACVVGVEHE